MSTGLTRDQDPELGLTRDQQRALTRLRQRIQAHILFVEEQLKLDPRPGYPPEWLKQPRHSNCFGLFGARGAGKTTLLQMLRKKPERLATGGLNSLATLDCSLAPAELPLGLSVVQHLHQQLHRPPRDSPRADPAFEKLQQAYLRAAPGFQAMIREMAVSPEHFGTLAAKEVTARFNLPRLVQDWLTQEAAELHHHLFLLPLDDLDLAPPGLPQGFLWSLLDELHQERLLFVIAADLELLEQRMAPPDHVRLDQRTTRMLLHKVVPQVQRVELHAFTAADRLDFMPYKSLPTTRLLQQLFEPNRFLEQFLKRHPRLLPPFPRGLENLYAHLAETTEEGRQPGELPSYLAACRNEDALGRKLAERECARWAARFAWSKLSLTDSSWRNLVHAARDPDEPLWHLIPDETGLPFDEAGNDAGFWVELLIDEALHEGVLSAWSLAERVQPIRDKIRSAEIRYEYSVTELDRYFWSPPPSLLAEFAWTSWGEPGDPTPVVLGWPTLLAYVHGEHDLWPTALLEKMLFGQQSLLTVLPDDRRQLKSNVPPADLLPRQLRSLIRFADALASAPWKALSLQERALSVGALIRLAAGLIRAAFLKAMNSTEAQISSPDLPFFQAVMHPDEAELLRWQEDDVQDHFNALPELPWKAETPGQVKTADSPPAEPAPAGEEASRAELNRCLEAYLRHPLFTHLRPLPTTT